MSMSDQIDQSARKADESADQVSAPEGANAPLDSVNLPKDDPLADLIRLIQQEDPFKDEDAATPASTSASDSAGVQKVNLRPVEDERPLTLNEIEAAIEAATAPVDVSPPEAPVSVQGSIQQSVSEDLGQAQNDFVPPVLEVHPPQKNVFEEAVDVPADPAPVLEAGTYVDPAELAPLVEENAKGVDPFDLDTALQEFRDSEKLNEQDFRNEQVSADVDAVNHVEPHFEAVATEPTVEQPQVVVQAAAIPDAVATPATPVQESQAVVPGAADLFDDAPSNGLLGSPYDDPAFEDYDQPDFEENSEFIADPQVAVVTEPPRSRRGSVFAIGLLIGLILTGSAMYFAFQPSSDPNSGGDVPFLRANQQPVKEIPENPGGEQIANQDRLVFNGEPSSTNNGAERLVSREEPVGQVQRTEPKDDSRPASIGSAIQTAGQLPQAVTPPPATSNGTAPVRTTVPPPSATAAPQPRRVRTVIVRPDGTVVTNPTASTSQTPTAPAPATAAPVAVAPPVAVANAPVNTIPLPQSRPAQLANANSGTTQVVASAQPAVRSAPTEPTRVTASPNNAPVRLLPTPSTVSPAPTQQTVAVGPSTAPAPAPVIASASGEYVVQIAARRSEEQALGAFEQVKSQYGSAIGNYRPLIQRADLGDRGVYYRLRVGPMRSQAEAKQVCDNLKAAGMGDCLVRER